MNRQKLQFNTKGVAVLERSKPKNDITLCKYTDSSNSMNKFIGTLLYFCGDNLLTFNAHN